MTLLLFIVVTVGLMWLLLIRPQQRRLREHEMLVASLEVGADILTQGGLYGAITDIDGDVAGLEIAPGVVVRIAKASVAALVDRSHPDDDPDDPDARSESDEPSDESSPEPVDESSEPVGEQNVES